MREVQWGLEGVEVSIEARAVYLDLTKPILPLLSAAAGEVITPAWWVVDYQYIVAVEALVRYGSNRNRAELNRDLKGGGSRA